MHKNWRTKSYKKFICPVGVAVPANFVQNILYEFRDRTWIQSLLCARGPRTPLARSRPRDCPFVCPGPPGCRATLMPRTFLAESLTGLNDFRGDQGTGRERGGRLWGTRGGGRGARKKRDRTKREKGSARTHTQSHTQEHLPCRPAGVRHTRAKVRWSTRRAHLFPATWPKYPRSSKVTGVLILWSPNVVSLFDMYF